MNEDELEVSFEEDEYGQAMLFWYGMDKKTLDNDSGLSAL